MVTSPMKPPASVADEPAALIVAPVPPNAVCAVLEETNPTTPAVSPASGDEMENPYVLAQS